MSSAALIEGTRDAHVAMLKPLAVKIANTARRHVHRREAVSSRVMTVTLAGSPNRFENRIRAATIEA